MYKPKVVFVLYIVVNIQNIKFTILNILSVQFRGIKYIHIVKPLMNIF